MGLGKGAREVPGTSVPRQAGILGEAWGSLQELILKAEGFPQTPPTFFKRCLIPCTQCTLQARLSFPAIECPPSSWRLGWFPAPCLGGPPSGAGSPLVLLSHDVLPQVLLVVALGGRDGARRPVDHDVGQQVVQGELPGKAGPKATLSAPGAAV